MPIKPLQRKEKLPFGRPLKQASLNLDEKSRSNLFTWRGQFSPQLIENLLDAYCELGSTVLDPFCGSGTLLYEAGCFGLKAFAYELNPAAYLLSKTYEYINIHPRERELLITSFISIFSGILPEPALLDSGVDIPVDVDCFKCRTSNIEFDDDEKQRPLLEALIILLDIYKNNLTPKFIHATLSKLTKTILAYPFSESTVHVTMGDARSLGIKNDAIDFVVTSPPYINVFNYHQNYRASAELLGWDLLKIAKSEIGSNRANRGNRFYTVVQYCLDMAATLKELQRVCKPGAKLIFIVGHESNVLGVPFYNAQLLSDIATKSGCFNLILRQSRHFKNKFGKVIREDLLHLVNQDSVIPISQWEVIAYESALVMLRGGLNSVPKKNYQDLEDAINRAHSVQGIPIYRKP